jgi:hypothetical protein
MADVAEAVQSSVESGGESHLNTVLAILVTLTAAFMALSNVKGGNIGQDMAQCQSRAVDAWSYYQAKSTKQNMAQYQAEALDLRLATEAAMAPEARKAVEEKAAFFRAEAARYDKEKGEIRAEAQALEAEYDHLNLHDDQFDLSEAALTVALALFGVTALVRKRWLVGVALAFLAFGVFMGLAGFLGWTVHPGFLARLFSA